MAAAESEWPPLSKDFYLRNPAPEVQTEEFCFGNFEAARPVLRDRTPEEVARYRESQGIRVHSVRGRPPPKPFQSFGETSFPSWVEELAYELFSKDAVPFPAQAQAWPCALAGMDVAAVAPTGSGKTLAYLLPALVHVMAQPHLRQGEGPIAVILEPTSELAQQTLAVAATFCAKTGGDDRLRAGAVYGGIDFKDQLPREGEPDFGRWPELLVATPARLLDLVSKKRLNSRRVSYVVFDEADELLSARSWLPQVEHLLSFVRPDRQMLLFSATWPRETEEVAQGLCGDELVQLRVSPEVPPIPQEVRLFPGRLEDVYCQAERQEALAEWLRDDLRPGEAALVLCQSERTAKELAESATVRAATQALVKVLSGRIDQRRAAYWDFVKGDARVLVAPWKVGGRGLDYADSAGGKASPMVPLSLAVVLFDFPPTLGEYTHCIGRTWRPGQAAGRAVSFIPDYRFWICRELAALMEDCGQPVPQRLAAQIAEDQRFVSECRTAMDRLKAGQDPRWEAEPADRVGAPAAPAATCGGDVDSERAVWQLPAALPSYRRRLLHGLADELGLAHVSAGEGPARRLHVALDRRSLPDKFFLQGEKVIVRTKGSEVARWAVVVDPKVARQRRTVRLRYDGEGRQEHDVSVDDVEPCPGGGAAAAGAAAPAAGGGAALATSAAEAT